LGRNYNKEITMDKDTIIGLLLAAVLLIAVILWGHAQARQKRELRAAAERRAKSAEALNELHRMARQATPHWPSPSTSRPSPVSRTSTTTTSRDDAADRRRRQDEEDEARRRRQSDDAFHQQQVQHQTLMAQSNFSAPEPSCSRRYDSDYGSSSHSSSCDSSSSSSSDSGSCSSSCD
jgi:cytoskeletal protein RodZ